MTHGTSTQNILINNDLITGSLRIPKGTTGDRVNPNTGDIRYNTTTNYLEYYDGSNWRSVTFQQNQTITKDTFTGDGVNTRFGPLSFTPSGANNILVFIQNVFQVGTTNYTLVNSTGGGTGTLNYINFGSIPPNGHSIVILHGFDKT
jgi:hypothetical protein